MYYWGTMGSVRIDHLRSVIGNEIIILNSNLRSSVPMNSDKLVLVSVIDEWVKESSFQDSDVAGRVSILQNRPKRCGFSG